MVAADKTIITVQTTVNAPVEKVWNLWNDPKAIVQWYTATPEWHTPRAENDLRVGGKFLFRMEAKDGSFGFDFNGEYTKVEEYKFIAFTLPDTRRVEITFEASGNTTHITETFEAEQTNPIEMQQGGWQAILNNFKKYAETK